MSIHFYRICVKGSFSKKGFGFSCMQMADRYHLTGTFFYESDQSVILEITGYKKDIEMLIERCKKADYINEIVVLNKTKTDKKLNDFIMLNQID